MTQLTRHEAMCLELRGQILRSYTSDLLSNVQPVKHHISQSGPSILQCSNAKGDWLQQLANLLELGIQACFISSKISFLKEYLTNCISQALTLIILSIRNIDTDVLLI